jgi:hypothetical protein
MHRGTKFDINQHFYFLILPDSRTNDLIYKLESFQSNSRSKYYNIYHKEEGDKRKCYHRQKIHYRTFSKNI